MGSPSESCRHSRPERGERRKAMETLSLGGGRKARGGRPERGERRKAMETCLILILIPHPYYDRNAVNAERQWRLQVSYFSCGIGSP